MALSFSLSALRRRSIWTWLAGTLALSLGTSALAQSYPNKPIRLVVTFPSGGAPDILARLFSEKAQLGQPVVSVGDGTVLYAKNMRGYGNLVIIDHSDGMVSAYGHNKTILVKEGQTVTKGQRIAEMGDTDTNSPKLHFELRVNGKPVNPTPYLQ